MKNTILRTLTGLMVFAAILIPRGTLAATWTQSNNDGFGDATNTSVNVITTFDSYLYAGTFHNGGVQIWRTADGATWTQANDDGFGDANNAVSSDGCVFENKLYIGTASIVTGVEVWSTSNGTTWSQANDDGFGSAANVAISSCAVYEGYIYFGNQTGGRTGGEIWRSNDGTSWTQANTGGFGDVDNTIIGNLVVYGNYIYATTTNEFTGTEIFRSSNGTDWTQVNTDGFGDANNTNLFGGGILRGELYFGDDNAAGAHLWKTADGATWTEVTGDFNNANTTTIYSYLSSEGTLVIGTADAGAGEVWSTTDGTTWTQETSDGFGDTNNEAFYPTVAFGGYAYAGTTNTTTGGEVWRAAIPDITDPIFGDLPGLDAPINITEGQTITTNPYTIQVMPTDRRGIAKVEFKIDDVLVCTDTEADDNGVYTCDWDTATYHSAVAVTAFDAAGNTSVITRNATVSLPVILPVILPETGVGSFWNNIIISVKLATS